MVDTNPEERDLKPTAALPALPEPTEQEQAAIAASRDKLGSKPQPPRVTVQLSASGQSCFDASHNDGRGWITHLRGTVGSNSSDFAMMGIRSLTSVLGADLAPEDKAAAVNSMLAVISGAAPQNEVEGMLAVQMAASHQLAMTLLARVGRA